MFLKLKIFIYKIEYIIIFQIFKYYNFIFKK